MTEETTNTEEQPQEVLQVTAGDLALLVKIIDAGSERGAWKGEELGTIGTIRTKMVAIVQSVAPVQDEVVADDETTEEVELVEEEVVDEKPKRKRSAKPSA